MAWTIMYDVMQWVDGNGDPASGYVVKAYEPGTTTPISIAIDRNGGGPQATVTLNAEGKPEVSGNEVMLFIDRDYKWAIFENASDAASNSNPYAGFFDNVPQQNSSSSIDYDGNATIKQRLDNLNVDSYASLRALTSSQLTNGDVVTVTDDGITGNFAVKTGTVTDNGATLIVFSDDSNRYAERLYSGAINVKWFGAKGDAPTTPSAGSGTDDRAAIQAAWDYCVTNAESLYIPAGGYRCLSRVVWGESVASSNLKDLNGITLFGDGESTVVWTDRTGGGSDVFNFNNCKNVTVRDIAASGIITAMTSPGTNGFSITNGFDNLTFENIYPTNLPFDPISGGGIDGGQGLSIQPVAVNPTIFGKLTARGVHAKGCSRGVGYDPTLADLSDKIPSIHIEGTVEDCYQGIAVSSAGASSAISANLNSGFNANVRVINCQRGLILGRGHGVNVEVDYSSSKTEAQKRINPNTSSDWNSTYSDVNGAEILYAKNSRIHLTGDMGNVGKKIRIGYGSPGSSGLSGETEYCDIYIDCGGTSSTQDLEIVSSGINSISNSFFRATNLSFSSFGTDISDPAQKNILNLIGNYTETAGNWTPVLADTSLTDKGATYSARFATYETQGNMCAFTCYMAITGLGTLATGDQVNIIGLPVASASTSGNISACTVGFYSGTALTSAGDIGARINSNTSHITLSKNLATSTAGHTALTVAEVSATGLLVISGSYRIA